MSRLDVNTLRHTAGSADNITLDNSQNVTIEGNLTVDGTLSGVSLGAALTGSTNNTITTVTGANAIQGEANLTFDGSMLQVTGDQQWSADGAGANELKWDAGDAKLYFRDNIKAAFGTGGDLEVFHDGSNSTINNTGSGNLKIQDGGNECIQIVGSHIRFHCGTNTPDASNAGAQFEKNGSNTILQISSANAGANHIEFFNENAQIGRIHSSGSNTTYATSSDYRLKENQVAISDGFTRVKALKPYRFNFKSDPSRTFDGFFAHEAATVVPEAVAGDKDAVKDGEIEPQGIDQSKLVPLLTAALQEAITKIETLEVKVAALEAG